MDASDALPRISASPVDARSTPPADTDERGTSVAGALTRGGALTVSATVETVTVDDGRYDVGLPGISLAGPGVECVVPLNADGEVTRLHGVYPANRRVQIEEIAADAARYGSGRYTIDAGGGWDLVAAEAA